MSFQVLSLHQRFLSLVTPECDYHPSQAVSLLLFIDSNLISLLASARCGLQSTGSHGLLNLVSTVMVSGCSILFPGNVFNKNQVSWLVLTFAALCQGKAKCRTSLELVDGCALVLRGGYCMSSTRWLVHMWW